MTKKAMIQKMVELGILDAPNAKAMERKSKQQVECTYNRAVPIRMAWLAEHGERK